MTLLITIFAAVIATAVWYKKAPDNTMHLGILCWMYWGAALMWMADAIFEYRELGAEYFAPALEDMINDSFLGFSVVALGLVIWIVCVLVKDSKGIIRTALQKR
ncbi:MAG: hypothetical protein IKH87_05265 [Firmicutes bacterium]|nr:hypothetical protein [Bacillota bacterium]MBR4143180.1 hypothetical protein [Bacillota bacterium]MBR6970119.1 hypothetical protein [Bacillota bacterium]